MKDRLISDSPAISHEKGNSAPQNTSTGSGSRPVKGKTKTETSAAEDARTLGRAPPGWLR
jgi:hypothetical protein